MDVGIRKTALLLVSTLLIISAIAQDDGEEATNSTTYRKHKRPIERIGAIGLALVPIRQIPILGKRVYGESCKSSDDIDSLYHNIAATNPNLKPDAVDKSPLENAMCKESVNLRCLSIYKGKFAFGDVEKLKYSCQCYNPFDPSRVGDQLTYDFKAKECRAKVRFLCGAYPDPKPDPNIFWRYDREPFVHNFECVTHATCTNISRRLSNNFYESKKSKRCVCNEGYLPNDAGHCYKPGEGEIPSHWIATFCLFLTAMIFAFVHPAIDEFRQSAFALTSRCSLGRYFNIDFLGFMDDPELPKHWYNSDGTEKSYGTIKSMLLLKKHIFEMKHTCFWKFGVFVRFEDDSTEVKDTKTSADIQWQKRHKKEVRDWLKDRRRERRGNTINANIDKRQFKKEFTFVRDYQEKKHRAALRSCLTENNETFIRHIHEISDKEFLEFVNDIQVPKTFPYTSYALDDHEVHNFDDYDEEGDNSKIVEEMLTSPELTSYTRNGVIKLRI